LIRWAGDAGSFVVPGPGRGFQRLPDVATQREEEMLVRWLVPDRRVQPHPLELPDAHERASLLLDRMTHRPPLATPELDRTALPEPRQLVRGITLACHTPRHAPPLGARRDRRLGRIVGPAARRRRYEAE